MGSEVSSVSGGPGQTRARARGPRDAGEGGRGRGGQRRGLRRGLDRRTHQLESARLGGELGVEEACRAAWREVVVGAGGTMPKEKRSGT